MHTYCYYLLTENARKDEVSDVMDLTTATPDSQERASQSPVNAFGLDIYPVDVQTLTPGSLKFEGIFQN